jgi:hypothetical protein
MEEISNQLLTLRRENEDLKDLNLRLNRELRRYQMAAPKDLLKPAEVPVDDLIPPWAVSANFLSPLLLAYDW